MPTKLHPTGEALGHPLRGPRTPGQGHELDGAEALRPVLKAPPSMADKADAAAARGRTPRQQAGNNSVIPPPSNRHSPRDDEQ
ncbi:MAG: IS5/IS1182 family transposase, partial [Candidatus Entotheonellia bacterium]